MTYKNLKRGDKIACPVKTCGYERLATDEDKIKYKVQVEETAKPKEETEDEDEKVGV